jgi:bisphosphoglycerate-independent phosphoglycerate mutase (AlkP superfamily)
VLRLYDEFLADLATRAENREFLLLLTSDHGNIENLRTLGHTENPVPLLAVGTGADRLRHRIHSLLDITPALVEWFGLPGSQPSS